MNGLKASWLREAVNIFVSCILVLILLRGYDAWTHYRDLKKSSLPPAPLAQVGSTLLLEGVDFSRSPMSLIIVSSPTCKYCLASKHFHSALFQIARSAGTPLYVVLPKLKDASRYVQELGVNNDALREYRQMSISVAGTPTIMGIDNEGRVKAVWSGLATPADETEIVDLVRTHSLSGAKAATRIDAPDFQPQELSSMGPKARFEIVDVRERDRANIAGEINIPAEELPFRAMHELDRTKLQLVDCTNIIWQECDTTIETLKRLQFDTATLGAGTYHARCKMTPVS